MHVVPRFSSGACSYFPSVQEWIRNANAADQSDGQSECMGGGGGSSGGRGGGEGDAGSNLVKASVFLAPAPFYVNPPPTFATKPQYSRGFNSLISRYLPRAYMSRNWSAQPYSIDLHRMMIDQLVNLSEILDAGLRLASVYSALPQYVALSSFTRESICSVDPGFRRHGSSKPYQETKSG